MKPFEFVESKTYAIAGVSRNNKKFGNYVFRKLKEKGYEVLPVNPNTTEIEGTACYADISSLPSNIEHLIVLTPKNQTLQVVDAAVSKGIKNIWVQQNSETKEVMEYASNKSNNFIFKKCIMMYAQPKGMHKFHRFINDLLKIK
jgi:predicted CoA-binding protein